MQSRIVLVSDDSNFFEYMVPKLFMRKNDELYRFSFTNILEQLHLLTNSLLIINSEETEEQTLQLLTLMNGTPSFVFSYNENPDFSVKAYKAGALNYITLLTPDDELKAKLTSALAIVSSIGKNKLYREILVNNHLITNTNEVFIDYKNLIEKELKKIQEHSGNAVLAAISPNEKTKFLLQSNQIETIILNNIRQNDILMNYAPNKYFLLLFDTNIESAEKIWEKICSQIPEKIYAGFTVTGLKNREQLINEALNKLHEAINKDTISQFEKSKDLVSGNFKLYRQEFNKKLEHVISPIFYLIQQKYNEKLFGMTIEQGMGEGYGLLCINSKKAKGEFRITSPGFSKVNIDITYRAESAENNNNELPQSKRITLEPEELEQGLIEDILEQFILEFKEEIGSDDA